VPIRAAVSSGIPAETLRLPSQMPWSVARVALRKGWD